MKLWHLPVRAASGAFILNSGLSKRGMDEEGAAKLHGFAGTAFPEVKDMEPDKFVKLLSAAEIGLGGALLTPFVPSGVAGTALSAFGAALMRLYLKAPGLTEENSVRPSGQGVAIAKDSWLAAIGAALVIDALTTGARDVTVGAAKSTRKRARRLRKQIR